MCNSKWNVTLYNMILFETIYSLIFLGENNFKTIQKPTQKDHLLINATFIGMPI
jgi:hypothetical protein